MKGMLLIKIQVYPWNSREKKSQTRVKNTQTRTDLKWNSPTRPENILESVPQPRPVSVRSGPVQGNSEFWVAPQVFQSRDMLVYFGNTYIPDTPPQGFFSKFLMGGNSKFSVPVGPQRGRSQMGGYLRKKSDWSQKCPLNAKLGHFFAILSMKYSFLKYFWA